MLPDERDSAYLWEMREAATDALDMAGGLTLETLKSNKWSRYALPMAIQVIGEAASHVSPAFQAAHPEIAWREIIGMRHRIVHDYRRVNWGIIWDVLQSELEPLLEHLDRMLSDTPPTTDRA